MLAITLLSFLILYYAWRISRTIADPDWALFNMMGFTGAVFGKDYTDCKMPTIHYYYWLLAKIVGRSVPRVRFLHVVIVSIPGLILCNAVGWWVGLAFIVLVNSGYMLSFHGNVGQLPAGFVALALVSNNPWVSVVLWCAALLFEPKLILAFIGYFLVYGHYVQLLAGLVTGAFVAGLIRIISPVYWNWLWEANIVITRRMTALRFKYLKDKITSWDRIFTLNYYALAWLFIGISYNYHDWKFYIAPALYVVILVMGIAVRNNHFLPLIPWMILCGIPAGVMVALCIADFVGGIFYWDYLWYRFYFGLYFSNMEAKALGEWLRDKPGSLWVNGMNSAIYIYAQKPPTGTIVEQIEIRDVMVERREAWKVMWSRKPPDWVVIGHEPVLAFDARGYRLRIKSAQGHAIFERAKE